jgi:hypothetical protein
MAFSLWEFLNFDSEELKRRLESMTDAEREAERQRASQEMDTTNQMKQENKNELYQ